MSETDTQTDTQNSDGAETSPDVANIAARILDEMPMPQEHAIAESQREEVPQGGEPAPVQSVLSTAELDASGEPWNPAIHATGADGKGVKTAKGTWRRRRGVGAARASLVGSPTRTGNPPQDALASQARAAGAACAHTIFMIGRALGGEEWQPRQNADINEVTMMEGAFGDYFVAKGYTEFPPGLALSIALSAYALPRFTMPQTQSRMVKIKTWIAGKWFAWKARGKPKATKDIGAGEA